MNVRRARVRDDVRRTYERELESDCEALLRVNGWMLYHTFDSRRSVAGFPDLVAIRGTRLLVLELKTETGKVTDAQREWLEAFAATGAECYVVRPRNVDELAAIVAR